jgi:hypothetical protein
MRNTTDVTGGTLITFDYYVNGSVLMLRFDHINRNLFYLFLYTKIVQI